MTDKYILDGHTPIPEEDLMKWAQWYEDSRDKRRVARTEVGASTVSTVFLGMDNNWGEGAPILFESMILDGPWADEMDRCSTWEEAEAMHERMVALASYPKPTLSDDSK